MSSNHAHPSPDIKTLPKSPGFWENAKRRFNRNRLGRFAYRVIFFLLIVGVFADFLAYDKPIFARYNGKTYFPIFQDYLSWVGLYQWDKELIHAKWSDLTLETSLWPPIRYNPSNLDRKNARCVGPFGNQRVSHWKYWHFLGTDRDGRDVLAGLIHGTRISLSVGVVAVGIAAFIGIILGAFAGYFGDNRLKIMRIQIWALGIGAIFGFFYAFQVRGFALRDALSLGPFKFLAQLGLSFTLFLIIILSTALLVRPLGKWIPFLGKPKNIWVDILISRTIEIFQTLPTLLVLITISGIVERASIYLTMVIIGFTSWPSIARFTRGEMLRTRNMDYIQAAKSLGFNEFRILFRHALPNSLAPVLVAISFGVAGAILLESSLSFLGLGVSDEMVTWGTLLSEARSNPSAWWLAIFPGFAIFLTVTVFNLLGETLRDALDPRQIE